MGYWLEDEDGWLGDFATNAGIAEMREDESTPDSLLKFLDSGIAVAEEVEKIADDLEDVEKLEHVKRMFSEAKPPVTLTDGSGSAEEE